MKIVFYGSGNMANAIFTGIVNSKSIEPENIFLTNKSNQGALEDYHNSLGVSYSYDDAELLKDADYVFLSTKPYDFLKLAERIRPHINADNKFISIMAGLPINYIK